MLKRLGDLLHGRLSQRGFHEHLAAASAAAHVQEAINRCLPQEVLGDIAFLSFSRGVVTLAAAHPAVHQIIREHEATLRQRITAAGTAVTEIHVRLMDLPGSQP